MGNGTLVLGAALGFSELVRLGIVARPPRIVAVQSENCDPLAQAFASGSTSVPEIHSTNTIAEGIAIARPVRGAQILKVIGECGGYFVTVSEHEIVSALTLVASGGYYIEPTSAATIAGLRKYLTISQGNEVIVSVFTGHGLKSTDTMLALLHARSSPS